jgi:hypothetical protein
VPVRFYRGDPDDEAPERFSVPDRKEQLDLLAAFDTYDTPTPTGIFRLVVSTDEKGYPTAVHLAQIMEEGRIIDAYHIDITAVEDAKDLAHEVVTPAAVQVGDARVAQETTQEEAKDAKKGA